MYNKQEILTKAHQIAKTLKGDYAACLKAGMLQAWSEARENIITTCTYKIHPSDAYARKQAKREGMKFDWEKKVWMFEGSLEQKKYFVEELAQYELVNGEIKNLETVYFELEKSNTKVRYEIKDLGAKWDKKLEWWVLEIPAYRLEKLRKHYEYKPFNIFDFEY